MLGANFQKIPLVYGMDTHKFSAKSEEILSEERLDALAEVLAEGFLHLAMTGQLDEVLSDDKCNPVTANGLMSGGKEGNVS